MGIASCVTIKMNLKIVVCMQARREMCFFHKKETKLEVTEEVFGNNKKNAES